MKVSVHMPPFVTVVCEKCKTDYGEAFLGQSVWCPKCKRWVLAERDDEDAEVSGRPPD